MDASSQAPHGDKRPYATDEDAIELVERLYGFKVESIKRQNGYADQNFHIQVDLKNSRNPHVTSLCQNGYLFKIVNTEDTQELDHVCGQIAMLQHLRKNGIVCPVAVPDIDGNLHTLQMIPDEARTGEVKHMVRLLEYIDGVTMASVPLTDELIIEGGKFLADFQLKLETFDDERINRPEYLWSMKNIPKLDSYISFLEDQENQSMATHVLSEWKRVEPQLKNLPHGVIHTDFHEQNMIVDKSRDGKYHVKAIIDFQDVNYGWTFLDLAVYMTHLMTYAAGRDPISVGGLCLSGYLKKRSLSQDELDLLYYCVVGRLTQVLILDSYNYTLYKDPYIKETLEFGWDKLKEILSTSSETTLNMWLEHCNSVPAN